MQEWNYFDKYQTSQVPLKTKYIFIRPTLEVFLNNHALCGTLALPKKIKLN